MKLANMVLELRGRIIWLRSRRQRPLQRQGIIRTVSERTAVPAEAGYASIR